MKTLAIVTVIFIVGFAAGMIVMAIMARGLYLEPLPPIPLWNGGFIA